MMQTETDRRKCCLAAINSKYIHTNLAVRSLRAYAGRHAPEWHCTVAEFSINQPEDSIVRKLFLENAEVYAFSVYIWNVRQVLSVVSDLKKLRPRAEIWLGGPEVSYHAEELLSEHSQIDLIMRGEGEESFAELLGAWAETAGDHAALPDARSAIPGISFRDQSGRLFRTPDRPPMELSGLPFPYRGCSLDRNHVYYYESQRGCPFRCSYCLSSIEKGVRFKPLAMIEEELLYFLGQGVRQVKFVDRTFNCSREHALSVWRFIREHDNGVTNFHFEAGADLLDEEEMELLETLRPGLIQLEFGVQSTNRETLEAIRRTVSMEKALANIRRLLAAQNVHIHVDLIAGLPKEDLAGFRRSFREVYGLKAFQLQLGFLKFLKGTEMAEEGDGYLRRSAPPYEVLSTPWLSYEELLELKGVEEMLEVHYNSRQFERTMEALEKCFPDAYTMYHALADFYESRKYTEMLHSRMRRYEILLEFIDAQGIDRSRMIPLLLRDAYARERLKHFPKWGEGFEFSNNFDYDNRDPLTGNALWASDIKMIRSK